MGKVTFTGPASPHKWPPVRWRQAVAAESRFSRGNAQAGSAGDGGGDRLHEAAIPDLREKAKNRHRGAGVRWRLSQYETTDVPMWPRPKTLFSAKKPPLGRDQRRLSDLRSRVTSQKKGHMRS
jgi:hypothetical protein